MSTIEVGKVVIREQFSGSYESTPEQSVAVSMGTNGLYLSIKPSGSNDPRARLYEVEHQPLTPSQAIDLGTMLLKAAELQPEYVSDHTKLDEERTRLVAKYKDLVSGLGLENPDLKMDAIDA